MIRHGTRRFLLLAAWLWLSCLPCAFARPVLVSLPSPEWSNPADYASTTSPLKNRVGGAEEWSSGRFSSGGDQTLEIATGSNGCEYENASGRRNWPNRDPIQEAGGINLYRYAGNDPINWIDPFGLEITYHPGGGLLEPSGSTPYLSGESIPENLVAGIYNTIPLAANTLEKLTGPVAHAFDALAKGLGNIAGNLSGDAKVGEGVKNMATVLPIILVPRCPFKAAAAEIAPTLVEQYALRAAERGFYPVMVRKAQEPQFITFLERGDVWKFGTTKNPATRYSQSVLDGIGEYGVQYSTEYSGTAEQARTLQNMKIDNFRLQNGLLPPGNKIKN